MQYRYLDDKRKSFVLLIVLVTTFALYNMTKCCYTAAMASIVDEGIMTKSQSGLITAVFYIVYAPFQIVGGIAADRFSPKKLIIFGLVSSAVVNLLMYTTNSYAAMLAIWSVNGIVQFGIYPSYMKIIFTELHERHRSLGVFLINISSLIGQIVSYIVAIVIGHWKNNFLFSAVLLGLLPVMYFLFYRSAEKSMSLRTVTAPAASVKQKKSERSVFGIVITSGLPLLMIVYAVHSTLNLGLKNIAPVMLMESYTAVTPAIANGLNTMIIAASIIGMSLAGLKIFQKMSPTKIIAFILTAELPLLFVITLIGNAALAFVVTSMISVMCLTGIATIVFSMLPRYFDIYGCVATLTGIFNCIAAVGIVLANYVLSRIAELRGWVFTSQCWFGATAVALVLALLAIPLWKRFIRNV